jgi:preprotein translocase subunit SecA
LRQGIHLRGYAQKNPEQEYKKEAFNLFVNMLAVIKSDVITDLSRVHVPTAEELAEMEAQQQAQAEAMKLNLSHAEVDGLTGDITLSEDSTFQFSAVDEQNIIPPSSRNAACPCGSGLKYKQCHGKI